MTPITVTIGIWGCVGPTHKRVASTIVSVLSPHSLANVCLGSFNASRKRACASI